ncbi:ABC transporter ATP-binding protein [Asanoa sp. NPDC050611]|uniref:ABC transporter ATP-binding protein n=1 Tax=Asanoa sp. NPDC050611 TaxID=3157098 RepID=UPI0033E5055B
MLDVSGIGHAYGSGAAAHTALRDVSFTVRQGEIVCIVGPSGCGKSTLLRAVSGLLPPSAGQSWLTGVPIRSVPDDLAFVFQEYGKSLFPWLTVRGNVAFPLKARRRSRQSRDRAVEDALSSVGLADAADKHPWQLSGGMQQRVAIARALACEPRLLLMDEPFASVDAQTRADLEDLLLRVRRAYRTTVLLVTHDIDESVYLADRVLVLSTAPGTVVADIDVTPLGPDRDQITTRESDGFVHLRGEVARLLRYGTDRHAPQEA